MRQYKVVYYPMAGQKWEEHVNARSLNSALWAVAKNLPLSVVKLCEDDDKGLVLYAMKDGTLFFVLQESK